MAYSKERDYHRAIIVNKNNIKKDTLDEFTKELCQLLCEETSSDSGKSDNAFCRHILFQNVEFSKVVVSDVWENEIRTRYEKLRKLSIQVPFEMQANVLTECLRSLDLSIFNLESWIHSNSLAPSAEEDTPVQNQEPVLQEILKQLLSLRMRDNSSTNLYAAYKVNNTQISKAKDMRAAFCELSISSRNVGLLRQARQGYLTDLAEHIESQKTGPIKQALEFEGKYNQLQDYLRYASFRMQYEELSSFVSNCCKQYCCSVIEYCTYNPKHEVMPMLSFTHEQYKAFLIDCIIKSHMDNAIGQYRELIYLISYFNAFSEGAKSSAFFHSKLFFDKDLSAGSLYRSESLDPAVKIYSYNALIFSELFQTAWTTFIDDRQIFDNDTHIFINHDSVAEILYETGKSAASYFGKDEFFFHSKSEILIAFGFYESVVSTPEKMISPLQFTESIPKLLLTVLFIVLHSIVKSTVPLVMDSIKLHFPQND